MTYIIIAIILFLIESEYNYRINLFNLEDLDKFEEKSDFINKDLNFKKAYFRWKHSKSRDSFIKYKTLKIRRVLFIHHCVRIFGEDKLIDMIEKKKDYLIEKYGEEINSDLELLKILVNYFSVSEFRKYIKNK